MGEGHSKFYEFYEILFPQKMLRPNRRGKEKHTKTTNIYCYYIGNMMK